MAECRPQVVHDLTPYFGPVTEAMATAGARHLPWKLGCRACGRGVTGTARWTAFARTLCPASLETPLCQLTRESHVLIREGTGWRCRRCGHRTIQEHRARCERSRCPVPAVCGPTGSTDWDAAGWMARHNMWAKAWRLWVRSAGHAGGGGAAVEEERLAAEGWGSKDGGARQPVLRWRPHLPVPDPAGSWCLNCGSRRPQTGRRGLQSTACPGQRPLRAWATIALRSGRIDGWLKAADRVTQARAAAQGWR